MADEDYDIQGVYPSGPLRLVSASPNGLPSAKVVIANIPVKRIARSLEGKRGIP
jgi:hypothetical protein